MAPNKAPVGFATPSLRATYAKHVLRQHLVQKLQKLPHRCYQRVLPPYSIPESLKPSHGAEIQKQLPGRVCIIGAGAAGMMIALCLREIGFDNFDILEASDRVGGRIYSHKFPQDPRCPHNYYDAGAMRLLDVPAMHSTFSLIKYLGIQDLKVPYIYQDKHKSEPVMYNFTARLPDDSKFRAIMDRVVEPLFHNYDEAFRTIIDRDGIDESSTRDYLSRKANPPLSYEEIEAAETATTSTQLFNQSFVETICDYFDFTASLKEDAKWYRLEGGMSTMTDAMEKLIGQRFGSAEGNYKGVKITRNSPVVAMADEGDAITVTTGGENPSVRPYAFVFNTTTMPALQRMDLEGLRLPEETFTAIRTLGYDSATKVAIKFSKPWWVPLGILEGGVSCCDLPIRSVVYPSWNDGLDTPAVLIVSYSWAADAIRMSSLIHQDCSKNSPTGNGLVDLCLRNLAKLWSAHAGGPSVEDLCDMYVSHDAYSWSQDAQASGAFAFFGPGQFKNIYPAFQELMCGQKLAICGEAVSTHHGWICGALDSGYASVLKWAGRWGSRQMQSLLKASPLGGGSGYQPTELDETLLYWCYALEEERNQFTEELPYSDSQPRHQTGRCCKIM